MSTVEDVWVHILRYLSAEEILKIRRVSKFLDLVAQSPRLWNNLLLERSKINNTIIFQNAIASLNSIKLVDCYQLSAANIVAMLKSQNRLTSLYLKSCNVDTTPDFIIRTVTNLVITSCDMQDETAHKWISCFPNIVALDLSFNPIYGQGWSLQGINLSFLNLSMTKIKSSFFDDCPFVSSLLVSQCYELDRDIFPYFIRNTKLENLDISLNIQFTVFILDLCHHPSLRRLNLRGLKDIPSQHVNRLFDTNNLVQLLDPLGIWRYR